MDTLTFALHFTGVSAAQANRLASELSEVLLDSHEDVRVERRRDDPTTQDMGGTLVLILGTPAIVAAVGAIKKFLTRSNATDLVVTTPQGTVVATNLESKDVSEIVRALASQAGS